MLTSVFLKSDINELMLTSIFQKIDVVLVKLNLYLSFLALILNHHSFIALSFLLLLFSHYHSHSHSHALSATAQPHPSRCRSCYHLILAITHSHALVLALTHKSTNSHSLTLALSLTHKNKRLVFYKCFFLCLILMVMVSKKLGLVLGFDDFQFSFWCAYYFCVCCCVCCGSEEMANTMMKINKKNRGNVRHCSCYGSGWKFQDYSQINMTWYNIFSYISLLVKCSLMVKSICPLL